MAQHPVKARFFDVEDFALQRQDRLVLAVAALLGGASGRVSLDNINLGQSRILLLAIGELARQHRSAQRAFAHNLACFSCRFTGAGGIDRLADNPARHRWILFEVLRQPLVQERLDCAFDVRIEFALRLSFKLRLRQLHGDDCDQTLAHVVAAERPLEVLCQARRLSVGVDGPGKRRTKARQVCAAVYGVDVVGERVDLLVVAVVVLNGHFDRQGIAFLLKVERLVVKR